MNNILKALQKDPNISNELVDTIAAVNPQQELINEINDFLTDYFSVEVFKDCQETLDYLTDAVALLQKVVY